MTLRLSVVSEHGIRLGEHSTKVFGVHGGTIGRGTDNAWILPDPERYLSGKHVRIDFRAGTYVLVDTSSNGTYVNGAQVPLGKYHDYVLKDGDYVRLGEYELLVSIDKSTDFPPDDGAIVAYDGQIALLGGQEIHRQRSGRGSRSQPAARAQRSVSTWNRRSSAQCLWTGGDGGRDANAHPPMRQPRMRRHALAHDDPAAQGGGPKARRKSWRRCCARRDRRSTRAISISGSPRSAAARALTRAPSRRSAQQCAAARGPAAARSGARTHGPESGPQRFPQPLSHVAPAGRMNGPESPLNLSQGVDEALVRLLTTVSTRAGSVEAIRENFRELKAQNVASLAAMRARHSRSSSDASTRRSSRSASSAPPSAAFSDPRTRPNIGICTRRCSRGLAQRPADGLPALFTEAFAKAYEAKLRALVPPRRGPFAGDPGDAAR